MSTLKYYDTTTSSWVPLVVGSQGPPGQVGSAQPPLYYDSGTQKISIAQNEIGISVNQVGGAVSLSGNNTLSGVNTFTNVANFSNVVATNMSVTATATAATDVTNKAYVDNAVNVASSGISSVTNTDGTITVNNADPKNPVLSLPTVVTTGTYTKVTVDANGRVTTGTSATPSDIGAAPTASPTFTGTATFTGVTLVGLTIDGGTA